MVAILQRRPGICKLPYLGGERNQLSLRTQLRSMGVKSGNAPDLIARAGLGENPDCYPTM